jgi:hypothetical protein
MAGTALAVSLAFLPLAAFVILRLLYLPITVAQRRPRELRACFEETRDRSWKILRSVGLSYTVILAVSGPVSLATHFLGENTPLWGLAAYLLLSAVVVAADECLSGAVLAESYRRVVLEAQNEGGEFALHDAGGTGTGNP